MTENKINPAELVGNETKFIAPDYGLKKFIGEDVNLKELFNEETIEKAQGAIDKHKESFVEWTLQDIMLMNDYHAKSVENPATCEPHINEIEKVSAMIMSRAGTFGYQLATLVAKSLSRFCQAHSQPTADHLMVIRKHIDTLSVIFAKQITGDGGNVGNELLENLFKLVDKYKAAS